MMPKKIQLYKGRPLRETEYFAIVDDEDFDRLSKHRWYVMEFYHCDTDIKYARRYERKKGGGQRHIMMHREIMNVSETHDVCDHIDHNGLNNSKSNLRICTHAENIGYRRKLSDSYGGKYKGVSKDEKNDAWKFVFKHDKIKYSESGFDTEIEAVMAYNKRLKEVKGEFAELNKIHE